MKQITIVSEDRPAIAAEITEALAAAGVNIEDLDLAVEPVGGTALFHLTVDKYDEALRALAATPFKAVTEDALVVQIEDRPGGLAAITRRFRDTNISLRSIRIIRRGGGKAVAAIASDRTEEARQLLKDILVS
jgi:histidine decarboxylase